MTKHVQVGGIPLGGGAPVTIQSMTNTDTGDTAATLGQIKALHAAGCDIVRVSVYDEDCAKAIPTLVAGSPLPLVADIHFDYRLAIAAAEGGVHKLRVNPGNIGGEEKVRAVADCAKAHHIPIRIGVNGGSLERDLLHKHGGPTPKALVESALRHARMLEVCGFDDIVLSVKASHVKDMIAANRLLSGQCDYPLHLGVTEAGLPGRGTVASAIGIGSLLLEGIGDTVRVSLSGDPLPEVTAAMDILRAVGLRGGVAIIACPTCGRTEIDIEGIAKTVERETAGWKENITVAVMGCVVNGPGEAREADLGIAGGGSGSVLFEKGKPPRKVTGDAKKALMDALHAYRKAIPKG